MSNIGKNIAITIVPTITAIKTIAKGSIAATTIVNNLLISDSKKEEFSLCIVHKMDRFSRDLYQTLYYTNKLKNNNVEVVSVSENYDTSTPEGMLLRNMMSSISEYFSKNLGKEVTKGMREDRKSVV